MSILSKFSKDLTSEDYDRIEKRIGERIRYPMMGLGEATDEKGNKSTVRYLGVLDRPLRVYSERSLDEVEGILLREMPTPEMMPLFYKAVTAMNPANTRRAMYFKGAPGSGKTYQAELIGRLASPKGAIKVDCTGLDLRELFYETVLDIGGNRRFYDALEEKIAKYNQVSGNAEKRSRILNPLSVDTLRDCLGEAFTEDPAGRISIDWAAVRHAHRDEQGNALSSRECSQIAIAGLKAVSAKEGLDSTGGNALGMKTQRGDAWRAYTEGRVLILDELNRAKRGTFGILHGWVQFMIGLDKECTVRNPFPEKGEGEDERMHFRQSEMRAGHFLFMTGNTEDDGDEVLELSEALSSRVVPQPVPKATVRGWQHRFCQALTGLPVSTIYEANRDEWDENKPGFGRLLKQWRSQGEDREVPEFHRIRLDCWQNTLQASENFAKFMDAAAKLVNPDSEWYKKATSLARLMDEINESFKKEVSMDFRKIGYFLSEAFQEQPIVRAPLHKDGKGLKITPILDVEDYSDDPADIQARIGTHLGYVILDWIVANTYERGKDGLGRQLMQTAKDCGVDVETLSKLLDDNPYQSDQPDVRAGLVRDLICQDLRERYPDITDRNEDILSVSMVHAAMQDMESESHDQAGQGILLFNDDPESLHALPLKKAKIVDEAEMPEGGKIKISELAARRAFLFAMVAPGMREKNLEGLWSQALESALSVRQPSFTKDEGLAVAQGLSESGLALTTVMVGGKQNQATPLHIIWNEKEGRLLVVGDGKLDADLKKAFRCSRTSYVDRTEQDAEKKIKAALGRVLGSDMADRENSLKRAFLMRAMGRSPHSEDKTSLAGLMASNDTRVYLPVYITNRSMG